MKKTLLTLLSFTMITLVGCAGNEMPTQNEQTIVSESNSVEGTLSFTYSLMSDEKTKSEIKQLMLENGIPLPNVESFFTSLDQFNDLVGDMKGSTEGFKTVSYPAELFDYDYIGTSWMKKLKFDDQQCRLTTFNLLKDVINVPIEPLIDDPNHSLSGDLEIEKTNPNVDFTEDELKAFKNLYVDIPVSENLSADALANAIQTEWKNRGISFDSHVKASLMSVFLNSSETNVAFAGHAGIVLESAEGYVLVEKLAQYAPYVASKFSTLDEMKSYLVSDYIAYNLPGMSQPLIFLNDNWLQ